MGSLDDIKLAQIATTIDRVSRLWNGEGILVTRMKSRYLHHRSLAQIDLKYNNSSLESNSQTYVQISTQTPAFSRSVKGWPTHSVKNVRDTPASTGRRAIGEDLGFEK